MTDEAYVKAEIERRLARTKEPLKNAHDLVRRLFAEGRDDDAWTILIAIGAIQRDGVEIATLHKLAMQRVERNMKRTHEAIDDLLKSLQDPEIARLPIQTYNEVKRALAFFAAQKAKRDAAAKNNSRKPRPNRGFPGWMREVVAKYAKTTRTPLPATALDLIQKAAEEHEYFEDKWPEERTVRRWYKDSGASGR